MTAPTHLQISPQITGEVILKSVQNAVVSCPWCQRIISTCNGTLTLAEVAQRIHLPLKVCEKLVVKAVQQHWMEVVTPAGQSEQVAAESQATPAAVPGDFWVDVNQALQEALGTAGVRLLQDAALMTRLSGAQLTRQEMSNFLIALELAATEQQRLQMNEQLDQLRSHYAA